jgi:transcriptional regulator with XRE-family HTH domain
MAKRRTDGSKKGTPRDDDVRVGARVKSRRIQLDMTQGDLAKGLGLTFQQVQKYEKGTNRIGSSRMVQLAQTLGVTPGYFFEDLMPVVASRDKALSTDVFNDFIASNDGAALMQAFVKIKSRGIRHQIVKLVGELAE